MKEISAVAVLTTLIFLFTAFAGALNPKWLRQPTRGRALGIYLGLAVFSLIIAVSAVPEKVDGSSPEKASLSAASEPGPSRVAASTEEQPASREHLALSSLISAFESLTDLQQEEWNLKHQWAYWVQGEGIVTEVSKTGVFSEIKDTAYEVTVELPGGDRAVLFYPPEQKEFVLRFDAGSALTFQGRLKKIQDWGFWRSGYVKVE